MQHIKRVCNKINIKTTIHRKIKNPEEHISRIFYVIDLKSD